MNDYNYTSAERLGVLVRLSSICYSPTIIADIFLVPFVSGSVIYSSHLGFRLSGSLNLPLVSLSHYSK
jgi:hypothetical protein